MSRRRLGGGSSGHRVKKRVGPATCARCGRVLGGVSRTRVGKLRGLSKSSKRPSRPFGGYLCPACSRQLIKESARA